jgi:hypothetical protein
MKYEKVICPNCNKTFDRAVGPTNHGRMAGGLKPKSRGCNCVTCSKKCSREYHNKPFKERDNLIKFLALRKQPNCSEI